MNLRISGLRRTSRIGSAGLFGYSTVIVALFLALLGPAIAPYVHAELVSSEVWAAPSEQFWLGTDRLGRDLLSRLLVGAQTTVLIAIVATAIAFTLGSALGLFSAVRGGRTDVFLGRIVDLFMAMPPLIMALLVIAGLGSTTIVLIFTMGLIEATRVFRLARAVGMELATLDYVDAARVRGESELWIIWRELLPNAAAPLAAEFGLRFYFCCPFPQRAQFPGAWRAASGRRLGQPGEGESRRPQSGLSFSDLSCRRNRPVDHRRQCSGRLQTLSGDQKRLPRARVTAASGRRPGTFLLRCSGPWSRRR